MPTRVFARARQFDSTAQSQAAELPLDRLKWRIWTVVFLVFLLGGMVSALLFVNRFPGSDTGTFFSGVPDTLARSLVVGLLTIGPLVAFVYSLWRFQLERMAWRSGTVDVMPFVLAANNQTIERPVAELTALFEAHLSRARLSNAAAVPTAGGSDEFITVVENAGDAAKGPWRVASRFVRLLLPQTAYQVFGTVLPGDAAHPCALSVVLVKLPKWSATPQVIREATWERAVEHAAHAIAAQILPRTRACRRPPWSTWLGRRLPAALFDAYQRAEMMQRGRRYDEAMRMLHQALAHDPNNVWLRLEIAQLQEQLDLRLDALLNYTDLITLARKSYPRPEEAALLVARYRYAVLLGLGDKLADQWWNRPELCQNRIHWTARERQREHLRLCLRRRLLDRYNNPPRRIRTAAGQWSAEELLDAHPSTLDSLERTRRFHPLRVLLTQLGQEELERLEADYRHRWLRRPRTRRALNQILPHRAIRLCIVWAHLRRVMAMRAVNQPTCAPPGRTDPRGLRGLQAMLAGNSWPPPVAQLKSVINHAIGSRRPKAWQTHYSAACGYAVALLSVDAGRAILQVEGTDRQQLSDLAINELTCAAARSDSGFLAPRWLLSEEPDLEQLRTTQEFRDYATSTFSPRRPIPVSPARIHIWEQASYVAALIATAGEAMEKVWHDRARRISGSTDIHDVESWWREEIEAWRYAYEIAVDHRDWPTRAAVITLVQDWFQREKGVGVAVDYPNYSEKELIRQYTNVVGHAPPDHLNTPAAVDNWADKVIDASDRRLSALAWAIQNGDRKIPPNVHEVCLPCMRMPRVAQRDLQRWMNVITSTDRKGDSISPDRLRRLCLRSGERWKRLSIWFNDFGRYSDGPHQRGKAFADSIATPVDRMAAVWQATRNAWLRDNNGAPWW